METVRTRVVYWGLAPNPLPPLKELLTLPTIKFQLLKVIMYDDMGITWGKNPN